MGFAEMFPSETAAALADRVVNPVPLPTPRRTAWAELGDFLAAPFTGAAQGVNESLRVFNRLAPRYSAGGTGLRAGAPRTVSDAMKRGEDAVAADIDEGLRHGADYWKADPMTTGWATNFLHDASRVVTKFAGYSLAGGTPGAVAGLGFDEGATSYMNLRDQGVDPGTAGKVALVHGGVTALSAGLPAVGATPLRSAILLGVTGPGSFMVESALSRDILQSADYPQLAATFDPFDSLGLALSVVPGTAVAAGVHGARARAARALPPEAVDAAHVQLQRDLVAGGNLGRLDEPTAGIVHAQALDEAHAAVDGGRQITLPDDIVDVERAAPVLDHLSEQLRAADVPRLVDEARVEGSRLGTETGPEARAADRLATDTTAQAEPSAPLQRALAATVDRPDLPVRLEDDGSPSRPAADLVRTEAQRAGQEAAEAITATQAAIECFLRLGAP